MQNIVIHVTKYTYRNKKGFTIPKVTLTENKPTHSNITANNTTEVIVSKKDIIIHVNHVSKTLSEANNVNNI